MSLQRTWEALKADGDGFLMRRISEYMSSFTLVKAVTMSCLIYSGVSYFGYRLGCVVQTVDI
jgi:hypothetical protein